MDKEIKARIKHKQNTLADWDSGYSDLVPLDGELISYSDTHKIKIGNGVRTLRDLPYLKVDSTDVRGLNAELDKKISFSNDDVNQEAIIIDGSGDEIAYSEESAKSAPPQIRLTSIRGSFAGTRGSQSEGGFTFWSEGSYIRLTFEVLSGSISEKDRFEICQSKGYGKSHGPLRKLRAYYRFPIEVFNGDNNRKFFTIELSTYDTNSRLWCSKYCGSTRGSIFCRIRRVLDSCERPDDFSDLTGSTQGGATKNFKDFSNVIELKYSLEDFVKRDRPCYLHIRL